MRSVRERARVPPQRQGSAPTIPIALDKAKSVPPESIAGSSFIVSPQQHTPVDDNVTFGGSDVYDSRDIVQTLESQRMEVKKILQRDQKFPMEAVSVYIFPFFFGLFFLFIFFFIVFKEDFFWSYSNCWCLERMEWGRGEERENCFVIIALSYYQVTSEVDYFYDKLGLDPSYFRSVTTPDVANHILCLYSAKSFSRLSENKWETCSISFFLKKRKTCVESCALPFFLTQIWY